VRLLVAAEKLGIVADDLTGAMDSSGYFAGLGFSTVVLFNPSFSSNSTVLVITTNSRVEAPKVARQLVRQAMQNMTGRIIYKKIDSTLRGNIGEELQAIAELTASQKVVIAPAFPAVDRTTVDGILLVKGVPVAQTQFASDPISPVNESSIPKLLKQSINDEIGCVSLKEIEDGPEVLRDIISNMPENFVVCDVVEQSHLRDIAQAALLGGGKWLLCGSGGLARELHLFIANVTKKEKKQSEVKEVGPVLVAVGTRNLVAAKQLLRAHEILGIPVLNLDLEKINVQDIGSGRLGSLSGEIEKLISEGNGLVVSSTFSRYVPAFKKDIAMIIAEIVANILASHMFVGLFLSGGDIAMYTCRRLNVSAIEVHGEIEPGVPAGKIIGGQYTGMRVITKAGGFGTGEAMVKSIKYLERGELP
jgi:uncharacterized protein YgbK (DUF1537 family)